MNVEQRIDRYFASIQTRDLEGLLALFAEDATMTLPDGRLLRGTAEIRQLFTSLFASPSVPTPRSTLIAGHKVACEIETRLPDGNIRLTANFYELDGQGQIQHLRHYMRGATGQAAR
jgi:ketosteroid isomerase-like protein